MRGKNKCKILREIRQRIAEENDIPLITKECTYQGECTGTCPRCESELRYLEQQLARRQAVGKAVTVAALSVSLMAGAAGCSLGGRDIQGDIPNITAPSTTAGEKGNNDGSLKLLPDGSQCDTNGDTVFEGEPYPLLGMIAAPTEEQTELVELEGDVAYIPDPTETMGAPIPDYVETVGAPPAPADWEETSEPGMLETVGGKG